MNRNPGFLCETLSGKKRLVHTLHGSQTVRIFEMKKKDILIQFYTEKKSKCPSSILTVVDPCPGSTCVDIDKCTNETADCGTGECVHIDYGFECIYLFEFGTVGVYPEFTCGDIDDCYSSASVIVDCVIKSSVNCLSEFDSECLQGYRLS